MALVLWITLFSRIGIESRRFLLPFYSYMEILKGNWRFLIENIGNIVLFFPLGVILKCINIGNDKKIFRIDFLLSLYIEIFQLTFGLGTFEVDDLIHNTFGVMIGYWLMTELKVYVIVYDGCNCDVIARPAIYGGKAYDISGDVSR